MRRRWIREETGRYVDEKLTLATLDDCPWRWKKLSEAGDIDRGSENASDTCTFAALLPRGGRLLLGSVIDTQNILGPCVHSCSAKTTFS